MEDLSNIKPKAFLRLSHVATQVFFLLFACFIDCRARLCSKQPSVGRKPFCSEASRFPCCITVRSLAATQEANSLPDVFIRLLGVSRSSFLWMRIVLDFFHSPGILLSSRHLLKSAVRMDRTFSSGGTGFCLLPGQCFCHFKRIFSDSGFEKTPF